jgi:hemerythrin superfamily protein
MKATTVLLHQHKVIRDLFDRVEKAPPRSKRKVFVELAQQLGAHDIVEREILYPAFEAEIDPTHDYWVALAEHGIIEFCLYLAGEAQSPEEFDARMTVLRELVIDHFEEEEEEFFPIVEKGFGEPWLLQLGPDVEQRFAELLAKDYKKLLIENVRQVIDGKLKLRSYEQMMHEKERAARVRRRKREKDRERWMSEGRKTKPKAAPKRRARG